ncbi:MAG: monovalent cation/H(+) antiporter subunit G [Actinomycetaceae bacterium]|nr:monovalent cation/H(+) antiporter subunit G [Actinomycetaceae bacterium]
MNWQLVETICNYLGALSFVFGSVFLLIAGIGMVRLPGLYERMHAAAKPQWLGVFLVAVGTVLVTRSASWTAVAILMVTLQTVSAPIGSHLLARAAYRGGQVDLSDLCDDELARDEAAAQQQRRSRPQTARKSS